MRLLLVDDEKLALMQLERMIRNELSEQDGRLIDIHSFQLVSDAISFAKEHSIDVVFLDINMPEMTGIEAAELLQTINPNIEVIFVTAYDDFAVQAFDLNAMDYLLKPLSMTRLQKTMERLSFIKDDRLANQQPDVVATQHYIQKIYCMRKIRFQQGDGEIQYPKWRTAKAQELFAYLLHHRGEFVPKYTIINMFSPELDKKRAMTQLYTVIYQIRRCLKESGIDIKIDNDSIQEGYCMRVEHTQLDVEQWEHTIAQLNEESSTYYESLANCLEQYEGDYMGDYDYLWAESERERLRQIWLQYARKLMQHYELEQKWQELLKLGDSIATYNPYEFDYGVMIMEAYRQLGQFDKLKHYYEKQEQFMLEELDMPLPDDMEQWYEEWKYSRKS